MLISSTHAWSKPNKTPNGFSYGDNRAFVYQGWTTNIVCMWSIIYRYIGSPQLNRVCRQLAQSTTALNHSWFTRSVVIKHVELTATRTFPFISNRLGSLSTSTQSKNWARYTLCSLCVKHSCKYMYLRPADWPPNTHTIKIYITHNRGYTYVDRLRVNIEMDFVQSSHRHMKINIAIIPLALLLSLNLSQGVYNL